MVNYIPSPINKSIKISIFANEDTITIPKLTGYPFIDFDLCKVLNKMPINDFIKTYILIFLEFPIMLFSSDLTILNIFMLSLYVLNYPLTTSNYLEDLKTINKDEMEKGIGSFKTFLGVNTDFDMDLNFSNYESLIFLIDLEKKKIFKKKKTKEILKLNNYLNNILNNKKDIKSNFLLKSISSLKTKIESINNIYNKKAKYQSNTYYYTNDNIIGINILIQEAFYEFILNIIIISDNNYQIDKTCSFIEKRTKNGLNNLSEEEEIFMQYFRSTDKYNYYYNNFIKEFDCFDELRISLLFCKEFSHLRKYDKNDQICYNINYFKIIDKFYSINSNNITMDISYNNLFDDFKEYKNMKNIIDIENQLFYLDKNVINSFLFFKKNKKNLFSFLKEREKAEIIIKSVDKVLLIELIQNNFSKFLTPYFYIRSSIVYIFSIVFPFFSFNTCIFYLANSLDNINKMVYFQRYYIYIIVKSIQKYYLVNQENCQFSELSYENIKNYCDIIKIHLNNNFILPNKEIFSFLKKMLNDRNNIEVQNNKKKADNEFVYKYNKIENYVKTIKYNIVEKEDDSLYFKYNGKKIEYNFLSYEVLFEEIFTLYNDYFLINNFNIEELNIKKVIHIIINIIYYLFQEDYNEKSMSLFLFKTVIILNELDDDINKHNEKISKCKTFTGKINPIS